MADTIPILLKDQKILLIGGGNVALQKAQVLHENNINFRIVALHVTHKLDDYCDNVTCKAFKLRDIEDETIIIDATGNEKIRKKLLRYKTKRNVLLNFVDQPKYCDFYFMALTKNRPLQIAVSSNGASPTAAQFFRDECEAMIPKDIGKYLEKKQREREAGVIDVKRTKNELLQKKTQVYLVGCGLGDVELLTLKAYRLIQSVDVVLYDHLISQQIMDIVPKKTKKIYVGKQKDYHTKSQEQINDLIIKYAKKGLKVARLKSGDPFVFGRGFEELIEVYQSGFHAEVIPGISSSISAPTMANIPVTARDYASGFSVVSAHLKGNSINLEWIELLRQKNHTVVVLMGLSRAKEIQECAQNINIDMDKPCAIISNASREEQSVQIGKLKKLHKMAQKAVRPAILVFGDVVNLPNIIKRIK